VGFWNGLSTLNNPDGTTACGRTVRDLLMEAPHMQAVAAEEAQISLFEGLVTRSWRQDQWDWFTVWSQLGRPSRIRLMAFTNALTSLRKSALAGETKSFISAIDALVDARIEKAIGFFLGEVEPRRPEGQVYILSTRELPDLLKIGFTKRSVEERLKEINSATGVLIPFGVRAAWDVSNPAEIEHRIHKRLAPFRVRADREFFQLDYRLAISAIGAVIEAAGVEAMDPFE
jgi:hypothetical protein